MSSDRTDNTLPIDLIRVAGMWKRYGLAMDQRLGQLLRGRRAGTSTHSGQWVLRDVNLTVRRGEALGIIGRNGAGKSTLLKVLTGVTPPSQGTVEVHGRIFPMIELNAGLHMELTGRENVRFLGSVVGLSRSEIEARMPDIMAFCDLGSWFDERVRMYSTGMLTRLGFAVAVHSDADVLLIDEVLSVGDFAFQKKCVERLSELSASGASIVFVSHNPYQIERMCDRAGWMDQGELADLGQSASVLHKYFEVVTRRSSPEQSKVVVERGRQGTGDIRVEKVDLLNSDGIVVSEIDACESITIRVYFVAREPVSEPNFAIRILDPHNTIMLSFASTMDRRGVVLSDDGYVDCAVAGIRLLPNVYTVQVKVSGDVMLDRVENATTFVVAASTDILIRTGNLGLFVVAAEWSFPDCAESSPMSSKEVMKTP